MLKPLWSKGHCHGKSHTILIKKAKNHISQSTIEASISTSTRWKRPTEEGFETSGGFELLAFHTIAFSGEDIKKGLAALGYKVPQSTFGIYTVVADFDQDVKAEKIGMLCLKKDEGICFSVITDDYT